MKKLNDCLSGQYENYILPFFWQHGEDDATLIREINAIENSGIKAVCVESRTHEEFCEDGWWHTMDVILRECEKRNMKVWILDDKHFPSGYANGIIPKKYPNQVMWGITERHIDVVGPQKHASVMFDWKSAPDDELLAVIACKRASEKGMLTGETIDITDGVYDGMVYFDLPEGSYRIVFLLKTHTGLDDTMRQYADKLTNFGGDAYLEAVYEPHWQHYSSQFGKTIAGFFSDEPCFGNNSSNGFYNATELGVRFTHYPYSEDVISELYKQYGGNTFSMLPFLWFTSENPHSANIRIAYMDCITNLYKKNFSEKLGNWCRSHGVEYIGHIIEDDGQHLMTGSSAGHFFRALDGQDMAGIDVVLCQVVPGMTDYGNAVSCSYKEADPDFFHFTLAKLGSSHAHIQPEKRGRAMCEIFGAYGWAEGLKMMKWLVDFMSVRGINHYVPHAFTPIFPDSDCPPHMFAQGKNPQYHRFADLMAYTNRICHIANGTHHVASAALLYHAEAYWSGGEYMKDDILARYLTERQLDFDIVPEDRLATSEIHNGRLHIGNADYPCLILPYAQFLTKRILTDAERIATAGVPVYCIDALPIDAESGIAADLPHVNVVSLDELSSVLYSSGCADITVVSSSGPVEKLRTCHYRDEDSDYYFITNEGIHEKIDVTLSLMGFRGDTFVLYDAMSNKTFCERTDENGNITLTLTPYCFVILAIGETVDLGDIPAYPHDKFASSRVHDGAWEVSLATQEEYPNFKHYCFTDKLFNITDRNENPRFSGHMQYKTVFKTCKLQPDERIILDLGEVGESVDVTVNGQKVGFSITPPYRFDITDAVCSTPQNHDNTLIAEVINHLGYQIQDSFSKYLLFEPSGILGPVKFEIYRRK